MGDKETGGDGQMWGAQKHHSVQVTPHDTPKGKYGTEELAQ